MPNGPELALRELKTRFNLHLDKATRVLYATDASIYRCEPLGVFFPRDEGDLIEAVVAFGEHGIRVLPRGAGTSLSGQAITSGLIVDLSRFRQMKMTGDRAQVGPGVVIDEIDRAAAPLGFRFGPIPASSNRATIGGLLANNGTGARSIIYGMASDHLLAARVLLANGTVRTFRRGDLDPRDELTSGVLAIAERLKDSPRWPKTWRNASGLDLPGIFRRQSLLPLLCGSEGSLGIILEAEISLSPKPQTSQLALFFYDDLISAMEAVPALLATRPSAVELMDRTLIELARQSPRFQLRLLKTSPAAVLIVEYEDQDGREAARELGAQMILDDPAAQREIWATRKEGLGILMSMRGARKPIPFIEDCAVPVERLPEYVRRLDAIIRQHGTEGAYYAHASAGCLHIRPLLDLRQPVERDRMKAIMDETVALVAEMGGTLTGEHGDGKSKTPYLERIFGLELVQAFDGVRQIFDPTGMFRPDLTAQLRLDVKPQPMRTLLSWPQPFFLEVERCNGEGACRKKEGVMCPSFQVTGDESLSTRGRANLLRAFLSGEDVCQALDQTLAKCLGCKACSSECPSTVDMASLKAEYGHLRGPSLRDRFFAHFPEMSQLGRLCGLTLPSFLKRLVGIHPLCPLPVPLRQSFAKRLPTPTTLATCQAILFVDTHLEYYEADLSTALMRLFAALELRVLPLRVGCCSRPAFSRGMLSKAKRDLQKLRLPGEQPIVVVEPSCLSMLRDDGPKLLPDLPFRRRLISVESFLGQHLDRLRALAPAQLTSSRPQVLYHAHCHQKAMGLAAEAKALLSLVADVSDIDCGCCGMAGSFGYDQETYDLGMTIARDRFLPALRKRGNALLAISGRSCREMALRAGIEAKHPVEVLVSLLLRNEENNSGPVRPGAP